MSKFLLVSARHGSDVLASEYRDFLVASGLQTDELDQVVLDSEIAVIGDLSTYQGVFLGGSPFNVTEPQYSPEQIHVQQELLALAKLKIPTMYVCFGASLLASNYGGAVGRTHAESAGPSEVILTSEGRKEPLLQGIPDRFVSLTGHTENVVELPDGATLLASGPTCPIQMYRLGETTWACQFHAEMDPQAMEARMRFYMDYGYFDRAEFDAIVQQIYQLDTSAANQILRNFVARFS